jgi:hypothetical protein
MLARMGGVNRIGACCYGQLAMTGFAKLSSGVLSRP